MSYSRRKRKSPTLETLLIILGSSCLFSLFFSSEDLDPYKIDRPDYQGRRLLEDVDAANCTPRSIEQFPPDFMTYAQRIHGGVTFHILISMYIFAAIAIICDDYFVSSLEKLCHTMKLQPDVAGATFMAAGSSAPELFTSVIGVFFAKSDVGTSTIVGSAIFNLLFIIAICGIFGGMLIELTWWPMMRDCSFYSLSVALLVAVIYDGRVHWYEATVMVVLYIIYIIIMYFNPRLGEFFTSKLNACCSRSGAKPECSPEIAIEREESQPLLSHNRIETSQKKEYGLIETQIELPLHVEDEFESPLSVPKGAFSKLRWAVMLPASICFMFTVPDCRRPGCWEKFWPLTFLFSVLWIAVLSYIMVWMVTIVGDTLGIPDTVMGLTLLAAGTSIPDALSSLFVARDGYGDMAVSNSIGSNVFDILLCLGLPWLIQTGMVTPNEELHINSSGLTYSAITLFGTVVFLIVALTVNKWRLDKKIGAICLAVYTIVIVFSCLYELNVFGPLNPPSCPRPKEY